MICNRSKIMLVTLLSLFSAEVTGVTVILVLSFRHTSSAFPVHDILGSILSHTVAGSAHVVPGLTYCFARGTAPSFKFLWVPILAFDTALLSIFLFQGYRTRDTPKRIGFSSMHMIHQHSLLNFLAYVAC